MQRVGALTQHFVESQFFFNVTSNYLGWAAVELMSLNETFLNSFLKLYEKLWVKWHNWTQRHFEYQIVNDISWSMRPRWYKCSNVNKGRNSFAFHTNWNMYLNCRISPKYGRSYKNVNVFKWKCRVKRLFLFKIISSKFFVRVNYATVKMQILPFFIFIEVNFLEFLEKVFS